MKLIVASVGLQSSDCLDVVGDATIDCDGSWGVSERLIQMWSRTLDNIRWEA
jgi:hypothetical protein